MNIRWNAFESAKSAELTFKDALDRLKVFLEPIYQSILRKEEFVQQWNCSDKSWK